MKVEFWLQKRTWSTLDFLPHLQSDSDASLSQKIDSDACLSHKTEESGLTWFNNHMDPEYKRFIVDLPHHVVKSRPSIQPPCTSAVDRPLIHAEMNKNAPLIPVRSKENHTASLEMTSNIPVKPISTIPMKRPNQTINTESVTKRTMAMNKQTTLSFQPSTTSTLIKPDSDRLDPSVKRPKLECVSVSAYVHPPSTATVHPRPSTATTSKSDPPCILSCPICNKSFPSDMSNILMNRHIDECLSVSFVEDDLFD